MKKESNNGAAGVSVVAKNRKARFDYHVEEDIEAGLVLMGSEVKAIRAGKVQLSDAYASIEDGEAYLVGMHIGEYKQATIIRHEPLRTRKLLLKKAEISRLKRKVEEKGYTLIPLEIYFKRGLAKVRIGLCKGKREYDKRHTIRDRDTKRDMRREGD